jgi:CBS domain containing-hemolysin-like protein
MPRRLNVSSARQRVAPRSWIVALTTAVLLFRLPAAVEASFLPPEVEDKLANFLAVFVLIFVPIVLIVLFWMVHVLPEKIAHKRHHPQFEAIRTLCLLSLVFGGLLWPIAWLWAYSRPVLHKAAYGTDLHEDAPDALKEEERQRDIDRLRGRAAYLAPLASTDELADLRARLDAIESRTREEGR